MLVDDSLAVASFTPEINKKSREGHFNLAEFFLVLINIYLYRSHDS